jgi:hypothetical protein
MKNPKESQCLGKFRFPTYEEVAAVVKKSRRRRHTAINAYRCAFCGGWHTGRPSGK